MALLDRYRSPKDGDDANDGGNLIGVEVIDVAAQEAEEVIHPAVELIDVSSYFGSFKALDKVNLAVEAGQVFSIIGPSGSGKSTLVRIVNQLQRQTSGVVKIFGREATQNKFDLRLLREDIGMVFQSFNLFPQYSVLTNVTIALRLVRSVSQEEAEHLAMEALERVSMTRHAPKKPGQLSGGEQQRVAIARAIAPQPKILLLDEPTASIDPELTKGVMNIVTEIAATEVTVLAVTHEMGFVSAISDQVVVMDHGRIVEVGPPSQVLGNPHHERTQRFLADVRYTHK